MKALTLTQPWASLVAIGEKRIETRSWGVPRNGLHVELAIHAAKHYPKREFAELTHSEPFYSALRPGGVYCYPELSCGKILCIVKVIRCRRTEDVVAQIGERERAFGNYDEGRYAIFLELVRRVNPPIDAIGHLGLWEWNT